MQHHRDFGAHFVGSVDNKSGVARYERADVVWRQEIIDYIHLHARRKTLNAGAHGVNFVRSERGDSCVRLAIEVGFDDDVHVDHGDPTEPRSSERFSRP